ncbi:tropomyosin-like [Nothobranchius furzeri]|uniref:tropomyosin-like n=1 Tax=Nothobranchius furzeri TaxID=105023 RepID=UPI003904CA29
MTSSKTKVTPCSDNIRPEPRSSQIFTDHLHRSSQIIKAFPYSTESDMSDQSNSTTEDTPMDYSAQMENQQLSENLHEANEKALELVNPLLQDLQESKMPLVGKAELKSSEIEVKKQEEQIGNLPEKNDLNIEKIQELTDKLTLSNSQIESKDQLIERLEASIESKREVIKQLESELESKVQSHKDVETLTDETFEEKCDQKQEILKEMISSLEDEFKMCVQTHEFMEALLCESERHLKHVTSRMEDPSFCKSETKIVKLLSPLIEVLLNPNVLSQRLVRDQHSIVYAQQVDELLNRPKKKKKKKKTKKKKTKKKKKKTRKKR